MSWSPVANDIAVALAEIAGQYGFYLVQVDDAGGFVASKRTFLSETCYSVAFSPNGKYIAVTREASPYFTLLKWDGTNLTEVANYTLPSRGAGVNWSPGQYIGVAGYNSKYFYLLKWDGTNLTKVAEYLLPCGTYGRVFDCAFSPIGLFPDGQYIGVTFRSGSPDKAAGFFLLRWDEVNLTKVDEYDVNPGVGERYGFTCRFSPNGQYIAVGHAGNSSFSLLKWDGTTLTLVAQYPFVHDEWIQGVSFNETGTLIGVAADESPYFLLLSWNEVNLTLVDSYNPDGKPVWNCPFKILLPPVADFSGTPTSGYVPLTVQFTDLSTNTPTSWLWDFGDGETSILQNPLHIYNTPGTFTVTLTATNAGGSDDEVKTDYITVLSGDPASPTDLRLSQCPQEFNPIEIKQGKPRFSAIYNDPNTGDIANNYQIQVNTNSSFTGTEVWNSGKTSMDNLDEGERCPEILYQGIKLTEDGTTYYWRIKFWDDEDNEGDWSVPGMFTMAGVKRRDSLLLPIRETSLERSALSPIREISLEREILLPSDN
ncbi:MAG TPA: PKD domain-containing protein [bacterium]|nr:PKD domain-containing protein [bacterium]